MNEILHFFLLSLLFGFLYHGRGGSFFCFKSGNYPTLFGIDETGTPYFNYGGTQAARIFWWAIPVTILTYNIVGANNLSMIYSIMIYFSEFILLFVSLVAFNHGPYQDFGSMPQLAETWLTNWLPKYAVNTPTWLKELLDFSGLVVIGLARGLVQSLPVLFISLKFLLLMPVGATMGIAYFIGYKFLPNGIGIKWFESHVDISEFLTGLFYGLGLSIIGILL